LLQSDDLERRNLSRRVHLVAVTFREHGRMEKGAVRTEQLAELFFLFGGRAQGHLAAPYHSAAR
jgi:hypothetical protein